MIKDFRISKKIRITFVIFFFIAFILNIVQFLDGKWLGMFSGSLFTFVSLLWAMKVHKGIVLKIDGEQLVLNHGWYRSSKSPFSIKDKYIEIKDITSIGQRRSVLKLTTSDGETFSVLYLNHLQRKELAELISKGIK